MRHINVHVGDSPFPVHPFSVGCATAAPPPRRPRRLQPPCVLAYSTFPAMHYEFYILQTAPLSPATRDPSSSQGIIGVDAAGSLRWQTRFVNPSPD